MTAADEMAVFYVHTASVETYVGTGAVGDIYETSGPIPCFIEEKRRWVRDANGEQVVSGTTIWCPPEHYDTFKPDSKVTANGHDSKVITRARADSGGLDLPDHLEVSLE